MTTPESLRTTPCVDRGYAERNVAMRQLDESMDGKQPGDPAKLARRC